MSEVTQKVEGKCPRCGGDEIERSEVIQTTSNYLAGAIFFCGICGLTSRVLVSDREAWYDVHKAWQSSEIQAESFEEFLATWGKKVGHVTHGSPEPLGPILPKVSGN